MVVIKLAVFRNASKRQSTIVSIGIMGDTPSDLFRHKFGVIGSSPQY